MWKLLIRLAVCIYTTFVLAAADESCTISLPDDIIALSPVILTSSSVNDFKLFKPTGKSTSLTEGTELLLACTGKNNVFKDKIFNIRQLKCSKGKFVDENEKVQPLKELVCKTIPSSSMQITTEKCSHGKGYIYKAGFTIKDQFYGPAYEICYDKTTENTFYTHSILNGAAMDYSISECTRRPFAANGMEFTTTAINAIYTQNNQIKRFEEIFGAKQAYINLKNFVYLARAHLAPDADFIFCYEKSATYYFVNVVAVFQYINVGNWLNAEKLARKVSATYKEDIESYNGYFGILELPKENGKLVEIYLDDAKKIEVPKYIWKVLFKPSTDAAIVFVTVNNLFKQTGPAEEICTNVCKKAGLEHPNFVDVTRGYTFCCELNEFKMIVDSLPDEVSASRLLTSIKCT